MWLCSESFCYAIAFCSFTGDPGLIFISCGVKTEMLGCVSLKHISVTVEVVVTTVLITLACVSL